MKNRNKNTQIGRHSICIMTHASRPRVIGNPEARASFATYRKSRAERTKGRLLRFGPVTVLAFSQK